MIYINPPMTNVKKVAFVTNRGPQCTPQFAYIITKVLQLKTVLLCHIWMQMLFCWSKILFFIFMLLISMTIDRLSTLIGFIDNNGNHLLCYKQFECRWRTGAVFASVCHLSQVELLVHFEMLWDRDPVLAWTIQ